MPLSVTNRLFTGYRWDDTIGLYDANARFYDPQLGQFAQPDSLIPQPYNPIALNRYAYVYNSPVNYTDPSGHFAIGPWDLLDIGSFALSARDFYNDPSWANAGWLALDTVSLLPIIPSVGAVRHAGKLGAVDNAARGMRYAPRSSGHHRRLQRAIIEGLDEGEVVAFRSMDWGWGRWARGGLDIPFKPGTAKKTILKGPNGLRVTDKGWFITDLDAAWGLNRSGMMDWETFEALRGGINVAYGKDVVLHGHHWQGLRDMVKGVYAVDNGKDYLRATVYVYGKNINGATGFLGSGSGLDMYRKYHRALVP